MIELAKSILLIVSALFPIVNPLGSSPIFLSLTREYSAATRRILAWKVTLNSFFLLAGSFLVGTHILAFFGISIPVVQVGGGLLVMATGWTMLRQKQEDEEPRAGPHQMSPGDIFENAFYPLTMPLTVGPGSISIAITLGANSPRYHGLDLQPFVPAIIASVLIAASVFLCYASAERLARLLGATGMTVIVRLSSFLLVCIGVQILWNGVKALLATLPGPLR